MGELSLIRDFVNDTNGDLQPLLQKARTAGSRWHTAFTGWSYGNIYCFEGIV